MSPTRAESKDVIFLACAATLGALSTCDRARIGAIITKAGRCISWGYNGAPPGLPHCEVNGHGWLNFARNAHPFVPQMQGLIVDGKPAEEQSQEQFHMEWANHYAEAEGCVNATHAEANAIAAAARQGISTEGGTLYVSQSPCVVCARLLIAAGIDRVVYQEEYRDPSGLRLLEEAGVG